MGDAMPSASEERALAEEVKAEAGQGEEHGKTEEEAQGETEGEQGNVEEQKNGGDGEGEDDEEPGECGFCLFMKSGPCRDSFIGWEQCIEQAEKDKEDMVEKCHKVTFMLKECMERNSDYYEPVLQAEKAMGDAALEEEAAATAAAPEGGANARPSDSQVPSQSENQPQAPPHVDTEERNIPTEEHRTQSSSEEHHIHASSDASAETLHPPDSHGAAQERSSA